VRELFSKVTIVRPTHREERLSGDREGWRMKKKVLGRGGGI
jgi:hypothetical protein